MRNRLLLLFIPFSGLSLAQATDYILNGDFESGATPVCWAQGHFASNWHTQQKYIVNGTQGLYLHSPDYYDHTINLPAGNCTGEFGSIGGFPKLSIGARSGNRYMGIGTYELIQQEYVSSLVPGLHYTLSLELVLSDMFPSSWNGTGRLKVGLAKSRVKYKSEDNLDKVCTEDYVTYQEDLFQDIHIIGSFDLNMEDYPPAEGWKRISASFRAWDNIDAYDWIFIDVEIPGYNPASTFSDMCFGDFVYIDDISLQRSEFCTSPCTPDLGQLEYWRYVDNTQTYGVPPTGVIVGGSAGQSFNIFVENAMGIDFTVFNHLGEEIYNQYAFDPNGLKDEGYPDYWFSWSGEDHAGNFLYPGNTVLVYNLRLWNCDPGSLIYYIGNELAYTPGNLDNVQGYDIVNYELIDCCEDHAYFQNTTFTSQYRKDVHDFISAGANVTTGTQGPVVVSSSANVLFHAGNAINLEPGFSVMPGGLLNLAISDCIYGSVKRMGTSGRPRPEQMPNGELIDVGITKGITVWPNPSLDGRVHVLAVSPDGPDVSGPTKLTASSMSGRVICEVTVPPGQVGDLAIPESGVYMVQAVDASRRTLGVVKVVVLE